jgi:hypothetical protein
MIKKEFLETSGTVFRALGCRQYEKRFIYEHEEMYVAFILVRSNFSEAYYHEIDCVIKELHPEIKPSEILERDFDFILRPRLILSPKMIPLELGEINIEEYERSLRDTLENFLKSVDEKGLKIIQDYEKKGYVLEKNAHELLSRY